MAIQKKLDWLVPIMSFFSTLTQFKALIINDYIIILQPVLLK